MSRWDWIGNNTNGWHDLDGNGNSYWLLNGSPTPFSPDGNIPSDSIYLSTMSTDPPMGGPVGLTVALFDNTASTRMSQSWQPYGAWGETGAITTAVLNAGCIWWCGLATTAFFDGSVDSSVDPYGRDDDYWGGLWQSGVTGNAYFNHGAFFSDGRPFEIGGSAIFNNGSTCNGVIDGDGVFLNGSTNNGTVKGNGTFDSSSSNNGTVNGQTLSPNQDVSAYLAALGMVQPPQAQPPSSGGGDGGGGGSGGGDGGGGGSGGTGGSSVTVIAGLLVA